MRIKEEETHLTLQEHDDDDDDDEFGQLLRLYYLHCRKDSVFDRGRKRFCVANSITHAIHSDLRGGVMCHCLNFAFIKIIVKEMFTL